MVSSTSITWSVSRKAVLVRPKPFDLSGAEWVGNGPSSRSTIVSDPTSCVSELWDCDWEGPDWEPSLALGNVRVEGFGRARLFNSQGRWSARLLRVMKPTVWCRYVFQLLSFQTSELSFTFERGELKH